ncbi:MAG: AhpC/TSA family protein [Bdellovibrionia bacterium]
MALYREFNGKLESFQYAVVYDSTGAHVPVSKFWSERTAILVFLRHFGCIACRSHAQDVWENREKLQQNGARIIFIGNGQSSYIEKFRADFNLGDAPIYTDPTLRAFELGGFKRGLSHVMNVESVKNGLELMSEGHRNGNPFSSKTGNNWQLGGVIVVHPGTRVTYHYISEALGDTPEAGEIPSENS